MSWVSQSTACDGKATVWGMWITSSLPLLPDPLWPGWAVHDKVLSMGSTWTVQSWNRIIIIIIIVIIIKIWNHTAGCWLYNIEVIDK